MLRSLIILNDENDEVEKPDFGKDSTGAPAIRFIVDSQSGININ